MRMAGIKKGGGGVLIPLAIYTHWPAAVIGLKVRNTRDEFFLCSHLSDFEVIGFLPYEAALTIAGLSGMSPSEGTTLVNPMHASDDRLSSMIFIRYTLSARDRFYYEASNG